LYENLIGNYTFLLFYNWTKTLTKMTKEQLTEFIQNVMIGLHENIREIRERKSWADSKEINYIETKLLTYNEILQLFKFTAKDMQLPEEELGL